VRDRLIKRSTILIWLGVALVLWPVVAAFLSGLLFAQGNFGMLVARVSHYAVAIAGTLSMIIGLFVISFGIWTRLRGIKAVKNDQ